MKRIIRRIIEMAFPQRVAEIRKKNHLRREAMQRMLEISKQLSDNGYKTEDIDSILRPVLNLYKSKRYDLIPSMLPDV